MGAVEFHDQIEVEGGCFRTVDGMGRDDLVLWLWRFHVRSLTKQSKVISTRYQSLDLYVKQNFVDFFGSLLFSIEIPQLFAIV